MQLLQSCALLLSVSVAAADIIGRPGSGRNLRRGQRQQIVHEQFENCVDGNNFDSPFLSVNTDVFLKDLVETANHAALMDGAPVWVNPANGYHLYWCRFPIACWVFADPVDWAATVTSGFTACHGLVHRIVAPADMTGVVPSPDSVFASIGTGTPWSTPTGQLVDGSTNHCDCSHVESTSGQVFETEITSDEMPWLPTATLCGMAPYMGAHLFTIGTAVQLPTGTTITMRCYRDICDLQLFIYYDPEHTLAFTGGLPGALVDTLGWDEGSCAPKFYLSDPSCKYKMTAFHIVVSYLQPQVVTLTGPASYVAVVGACGVECAANTDASSCTDQPHQYLNYCNVSGTDCLDNWCPKRFGGGGGRPGPSGPSGPSSPSSPSSPSGPGGPPGSPDCVQPDMGTPSGGTTGIFR